MIWVAVSPFVEGGPGESADTPQASISPAASVLLPAPTSPVARWPPMADPNDIFPPVSPLALLTPLETPAAAPWPPLSPFPPTAALDVAIAIPLDPPAAAAPLPPALPVAQLRWASDAAMAVPLDAVDPLDATGPLDAADWSRVTKTLAVKDLHESDRMVAPDGGWGDAIKADVERLVESVSACPSELAAVRWILTEAVQLYPFTGYTQVRRRPLFSQSMWCIGIAHVVSFSFTAHVFLGKNYLKLENGHQFCSDRRVLTVPPCPVI